MTKTMVRTGLTDAATGFLRERDRFIAKAKRFEAEGKVREAAEARDTARFIAEEVVEMADPEEIRREMGRCERMESASDDPEARTRWGARADNCRDLIHMVEKEAAKRRARNADFSFVKPILSGHEGESVLDG